MFTGGFSLVGWQVVGVGISVGEHFETLFTLEASLVLVPTNSWERKSREGTWK